MTQAPLQHTLLIDGMSCDHCVARVRRALEGVPGLTLGEVRIGSAVVTAAPDAIEQALRALDEAGHAARVAR